MGTERTGDLNPNFFRKENEAVAVHFKMSSCLSLSLSLYIYIYMPWYTRISNFEIK